MFRAKFSVGSFNRPIIVGVLSLTTQPPRRDILCLYKRQSYWMSQLCFVLWYTHSCLVPMTTSPRNSLSYFMISRPLKRTCSPFVCMLGICLHVLFWFGWYVTFCDYSHDANFKFSQRLNSTADEFKRSRAGRVKDPASPAAHSMRIYSALSFLHCVSRPEITIIE